MSRQQALGVVLLLAGAGLSWWVYREATVMLTYHGWLPIFGPFSVAMGARSILSPPATLGQLDRTGWIVAVAGTALGFAFREWLVSL